jgi:uncharacterized protein (TIGR02145 family)
MLVRTGSVTEILITTAKVSGEILDLGEGATNYGHCYATTANPTITGTKTELVNPVLGKYTSTLTGLSASTKYHVRAYLSRGTEVVYGIDSTFKTASDALPEIITDSVTGIAKTSAVCGGNITSQGGTPVTARGVCWSLATITTLTNNKTTDGEGIGTFSSDITGLSPGTNYYVRAYATNSGGTKLGNEITFSTMPDTPVPPTVTTAEVTSVTSNSAVCGGNVTSEGSSSVTDKGICWNTLDHPTTLDYHTSNGTGPGIFVSDIPEGNPALLTGTLYHVRTYAINGAGTSYGTPERTFITCRAPLATTDTAINVGSSKVTLKGVVNANSLNDSITKVFFEYGITSSYGNTIAAIPGSLTGSIDNTVSVKLTGLTPDTKYYFRIKAINCGGTSYGNQLCFQTDPETATDVDGNVYNVVRIGSQLWIKENLKTTKFNDGSAIPLVIDNTAWAGLTTPGYCWYNNNETTYKNTYGALYNWYTVNTGKLCPIGWYVSTDAEWTILTTFLGGYQVAGGKLKETDTTHWNSPNTGATNETDFTALPGGYRYDFDGSFLVLGIYGIWWTQTNVREMNNRSSAIITSGYSYKCGFSVRCLKN